jgi:5-methylcytosine-specific restriction endonuclease McrA
MGIAMPIKPENKKLYPKNWKAIRESILERADYRCEQCGVINYSYVIRYDGDKFYNVTLAEGLDEYDSRFIHIILIIVHLDHDPTNNDPSNLRALCQRCHNRYDAKHRQANARKTRQCRKAIREMF